MTQFYGGPLDGLVVPEAPPEPARLWLSRVTVKYDDKTSFQFWSPATQPTKFTAKYSRDHAGKLRHVKTEIL